MYKYLIFTLLVLININLSGQDSCVVKVQLCDCQNCYLGFNQVENLNTDIKKTIVFPDISKEEVNAYINNVLKIKDVSKYHVIVSDSLYGSISKKHSSEVILYSNGNEESRFLLKKSFEFLSERNSIDDTLSKVDLQGKNIVLSSNISLLKNSDYFLITDYLFGNLVFINRKNLTVSKVLSNKGFDYKSFFSSINVLKDNYLNYEKFKNYLKQVNFVYARFLLLQGTHDQLNAMFQLPLIKIEGNRLNILPVSVPVKFKTPADFQIFDIDEESLPKGYFVSAQTVYFADSLAYMYLLPSGKFKDTVKSKYFLAKFTIKNNVLFFKSFFKHSLPEEYLEADFYNDLSFPSITGEGLVFFNFSNVLFDVKKNKKFLMPFDDINLSVTSTEEGEKKVISDGFIIDVLVKNKKFYVLRSYRYKTEKKYFFSVLNEKMEVLTNKEIINFPVFNDVKTNPSFVNKEHIMFVDKNNNFVVKKLKFKDEGGNKAE